MAQLLGNLQDRVGRVPNFGDQIGDDASVVAELHEEGVAREECDREADAARVEFAEQQVAAHLLEDFVDHLQLLLFDVGAGED